MPDVHIYTGPPDPELLELLKEWLGYWADLDAISKMPDALHVRTAMALQKHGYDVIKVVDR